MKTYNKLNRLAIILSASLFSATAVSQTSGDEDVKFDPASYKKGGFYLVPVLGIDVSDNDNIYSVSTNETSATITTVRPGIKSKADFGISELTIDYLHAAGFYSSGSDDDFNDNFLTVGLEVEPNHRNQFDLGVAFNQGHEARDSTTVGSVPDEFDENVFDFKYTLGHEDSVGRVELKYDYSDKEYTNNRATTAADDHDISGVGTTLYYNLGGRTSLLLEAVLSEIDYVDSTSARDADTNTYNAGVQWDATGKTSGTLKLGQTKRDFDNATFNDVTLDSWEVQALFSPKTYSQLAFTSSREFRETQATSGGSAIDVESFGFSWQHAWNGRFKTTLSADLSEEDYLGSTRRDDLETYGVRFDYNIRRWVEMGLSLSQKDVESTNAISTYDQSIVSLHVLVGL